MAIDGKDMDAVKGLLPSLYLQKEKVSQFIQQREVLHQEENVLTHALDFPGLKGFQKDQIVTRIKLISALKEMTPVHAIKAIRKVYDKYVEADERKTITIQKEMMKETLSEIESAAKRFQTITQFLSFIDEIVMKNNQIQEWSKDSSADVVKLLTIHKAKGLEFPVVFLIGASERILPHSSVMDEKTNKFNQEKAATWESERRLTYVAVTRAEEELYISSPKEYRGGNVEISRFITDVYREPESNKYAKINTAQNGHIKKQYNHQQSSKKIKKKESIMAFDCTNPSCSAWVRLTEDEFKDSQERRCPLCGEKMEKKMKDVVSTK